MPPDANNATPNWSKYVWVGLVGAAAGAAWSRDQVAESKRSRAERDDPELVEEVCEQVNGALEEWMPEEIYESEDDFTEDLADFTHEQSGLEVETFPSTTEGKPDILIEGVLALEVKISPSKGERDRCVGQAMGYSRSWATWVILIDAPRSSVQALERLLVDKGVEHIVVWSIELDD